ncbi:hypothetical protein GCM10020331_030820 [Ectobacillus funiculus]
MLKTITPAEVEQRLKEGETLFLVDVREHEEVAYGKIPEAVHIPMGEIPNKLDSFDKDHEYIFHLQVRCSKRERLPLFRSSWL